MFVISFIFDTAYIDRPTGSTNFNSAIIFGITGFPNFISQLNSVRDIHSRKFAYYYADGVSGNISHGGVFRRHENPTTAAA